jgi:hypothetical protein
MGVVLLMRHIDKRQKKARHPCGSGLNPIREKLEERGATISRSFPTTNDQLIICIVVNAYID